MSETGSLANITNFQELIPFLRDELNWPIEEGSSYGPEYFDDITFEYDPAELGLKSEYTARIREIRQLRPLATGQPWGIFFISFEDKKLPVSVLKRVLGGLVVKKRQSADDEAHKGWRMHDLLFISGFGVSGERQLSFLHFSVDGEGAGKPILRELGWDKMDPLLKRQYVYDQLKEFLTYPEDESDADAWRKQWASAFTTRYGEAISTAKQLTQILAELATRIRESANEVLEHENSSGPLTVILENFKQALFHHLTPDDFADMYAQTICYGLLVARISRESGALVANDAALMAPVTHPFLKELMETFLAVGNRKTDIDFNELGVNEVVETLRATNMDAVLRDFDNRNPDEDPVLHFYEHFLRDYDSIKREQRGVYYTPKPVVRFIVRSVDVILQQQYGLEDGLADTTTWGELAERKPEITIPEDVSPEEPFVQILDPAIGTGTFLVEVIELVNDRMKSKWRNGGKQDDEIIPLWNDYVRKHLLPRLHGFELLMAAYAICHIKIGIELSNTGFKAKEGDRVRVFLTNTLEEPVDPSTEFEFISDALGVEARGANEVKQSTPITVVIGNPPYSLMSANLGAKQRLIIDAYRYLDGKKIKERGALQFEKNLQDDYVKFWRFSQVQIEKVGIGIVGLITNHAFLTNPTLRGMRQSILQSFDEHFFFDLHGNTKRKERPPSGVTDKNVFDIQQGVSISIATRFSKGSVESVHFVDIWGSRKHKFSVL